MKSLASAPAPLGVERPVPGLDRVAGVRGQLDGLRPGVGRGLRGQLVQHGVDRAAAKGSRESVVFVDDAQELTEGAVLLIPGAGRGDQWIHGR